jgi:hypothetical protein
VAGERSIALLSPGVPRPESDDAELDFRGSRRLTGREEWFWYLLAGISYITMSMFHKGLLNWIIGPLWLVAVVVVGPALWDRLRGFIRARPEHTNR